MQHSDFDDQVAGVASLNEPVRRALYWFVVSQSEPVTRNQAAEAVGVQRALAAHHLDRLAEDGLLEVEFRRLSGRRGPGAGRPSKLYRRSDRQITVSLPERRYDLAGHLLARAITDAQRDNGDVQDALRSAARELGRRLGAQAAHRAGPRASRSALQTAALAVLGEHGFEPYVQDDDVLLRNCPFHILAKDHPHLVCGMNLWLMEGLVNGLDQEHVGLHPRLEPQPGRCCLTFTRS